MTMKCLAIRSLMLSIAMILGRTSQAVHRVGSTLLMRWIVGSSALDRGGVVVIGSVALQKMKRKENGI